MPIVLGGNSGAGSPSNEYQNGKPIFAGQLRYVPPYYDDLRAPATAFQGAGVNDPAFLLFENNGVGSVGVFSWQFSATLNQDLFFWLQLPHSWKQGTALYPHIHWAPMSNAVGDVAWSYEATVATIGAVFPLAFQDNIFAAASGVAKEHMVSPFLPIAPTGDLISTMIGFRIRRRGANVLDTYPGLASIFEFDLHILKDTPGSRQPTVK